MFCEGEMTVNDCFARIHRIKSDNYEKCCICEGRGFNTLIAFGDPGTVKERCSHCDGTGYTKKIKINWGE